MEGGMENENNQVKGSQEVDKVDNGDYGKGTAVVEGVVEYQQTNPRLEGAG
ncbi:hypothetical protein PAXRUDRAFT_19557 [Paxillus rubicundulus Ve08.2h10]|uniref:Unplaced genomic scaffold scaffold_3757, whole genome shotgun sequence n=1 Tax=Paxillus rubicundulus Ve08.2h10 TaxID=930991 RepID=A0A0D0D457_9AGAM|nr:hypothetical protein PAXRUDRAFT_19557 [Paxillus rubicundulus Ve08.2h10]